MLSEFSDFGIRISVLSKVEMYRMLKPFFVWKNKELNKINPEEVIWFSIKGNYTRIYLADKHFTWCDPVCASGMRSSLSWREKCSKGD